MVTYFNRKDMISFGKYLLSTERTELIKSSKNFKEEDLQEVFHADVENWLHQQKS